MDEELRLQEDVIASWVRLTGILKNTRLTQGMIYNEAIVLLIVNRRYEEDGVGLVSFKEIVNETHMLKSLVNRTIESLVRKGLLERSDGEQDRRTTYVKPIPENFTEYHALHKRTLAMVEELIGIIGTEDAEAFVRLTNKIVEANFSV